MGSFFKHSFTMCSGGGKCAHITGIILSGIACVFLIVAMSGWSDDCDQVANQVSWGWKVVSLGGLADIEYGIGLQGIATKSSSSLGSVANTCVLLMFKDAPSGVSSYAEDCEEAGEATIGLLILAFFLFAINAVVSIVRCMDKGGKMLKIVAIVLTSLGTLFALIAAINFQVNCNSKVELVANEEPAPFVGFFCALVGGIFGLAVAIVSCCSSSSSQKSDIADQ